ncbi:bifunctional diguanylate cyclase/phosphodiesterase [Photobacterium leiognathi]|uniref:bifunctional diguanylate cyclase/phosphodiesterase n=1 Tax=Photobacterium leiognathi TaxID=553611 RepID=UPI0027376147|nr:GGDEF domain-containing protein [Photobacterium leiognathi]
MLLRSKYFQYQPIFYKNKVVAYEALLRLPDKKVNIENFVQTYVNKGYFDLNVITHVLSDIKKNNKQVYVSINISSTSLINDEFIAYLLSIKEDFKYFYLEITEHDNVEDIEKMRENCQILQKNGLKIALDDYGKGYSNTDILLSIDFDYVKIDKLLTNKIETSFFSYKLLESIVSDISSLTNSLIVIEGIESEKNLQLIKNIERKYNVNFLHQGYYYSKPLPISVLQNNEKIEYNFKKLDDISSFYNEVEQKIYNTICENDFDNVNELLKFDPFNTFKINYKQSNKEIVSNFISAFYHNSNTSFDIGNFLANAMINNAECMVIIRDINGEVIFNNKKHIQFYGFDLVGHSIDEIKETLPGYDACLQADLELIESDNIVLSKEEVVLINGEEKTFVTQRNKVICGDNLFVMTSVYDKDDAKVEKIDSLTSCYTRDHLSDDLNDYQYVAFIDLNNFKYINDNYGHEKGDDVLKVTAEIIQKHFRYGDIVIRLGGDEFLIFSNIESHEKFDKRLAQVNHEIEIATKNFVSIAYGVTNIEHDYQEAIVTADQLMYKQKYDRKNTLVNA